MTVLLDIILVLVVIEAAGVVWRRYARGEASALAGDLANLGSGFFLMLAVRIAWTNYSALLVILLITLAGASHAYDLMRRFRKDGAAQKKAPQFGAPATSPEEMPPY
jgi:hypothetical protein